MNIGPSLTPQYILAVKPLAYQRVFQSLHGHITGSGESYQSVTQRIITIADLKLREALLSIAACFNGIVNRSVVDQKINAAHAKSHIHVLRAIASRLDPALFLSFTASDTLDSRITFTRASSGTHFDSTGRLVVDANDVARFDYDPVTLQPRGLLIEESRTNLLLHSRDMTQAAWSKTDVTPTRNQVGIDGSANSACLMTEGSAGTAITTQSASGGTANTAIDGSLVLKRGNTDWVRIIVSQAGITNGAEMWVNLATGAKGTTQARGTGSAVSGNVRSLGGGWYRADLTCVGDAVSTAPQITILSASADGSATRVNNATYIVDCAQLEVGAFATPSVITTGAATATRALDVNSSTAVMVGSTGTVVIEAIAPPLIGTRVLYSLDDGTSSNQIVIYLNTGGVITCLWKVGGVAQAAINTTAVTAGATFKLAFAWALNDFAVSLNGATVLTDTLGTVPTVTTRRIGMEVGNNNQWNSQIRALREYSTRLPDATLRALST